MAATKYLLISLLSSACCFGGIDPDVVKNRQFFFVQYARYLENPPMLGFGTIAFKTTDFALSLQTHDGRRRSASGSYQIDEHSRIWAGSDTNSGDSFVNITNGLVSFDATVIAGGQDRNNTPGLRSTFFFAIRSPVEPSATSDLNGSYAFIMTQTFETEGGYSLGYSNNVGKVVFNGAGGGSMTLSTSTIEGVSTGSLSTSYSINRDGTGTLRLDSATFVIGMSADKNAFIGMRVNAPEGSVALMIAMRDSPNPQKERLSGAYALLRMAPDVARINLTRDVPYSGLGYITSDGTGSVGGAVLDNRPLDFVVDNYSEEPFSGTFRTTSSGGTEIRMSGSSKTLTGYQVGSSGGLIAAILNDREDHGIAIAFRVGPVVGDRAVVEAAQFSAPVAPGSIMSIFGVGLGPWKGLAVGFQPGTSKLRTEAGGVTVSVNGIPCPLYYVSFGQINCQMPFEVAGQTRVSLTATFAGVTSPSEFARIAPVGPGLFQGAIVNALTNRLITQAVPARPGDYLAFYMTGLGLVEGGAATGQAATSAQKAIAAFRAQVNFREVAIDYAGLSPGFVGLYQVNIRLPNDTPPGAATFSFGWRDNPSIGVSANVPVGN